MALSLLVINGSIFSRAGGGGGGACSLSTSAKKFLYASVTVCCCFAVKFNVLLSVSVTLFNRYSAVGTLGTLCISVCAETCTVINISNSTRMISFFILLLILIFTFQFLLFNFYFLIFTFYFLLFNFYFLLFTFYFSISLITA